MKEVWVKPQINRIEFNDRDSILLASGGGTVR